MTTPNLTPEALGEMKALDEARTQGQWYVESDDSEEGRGRFTGYSVRAELLSRDYDIIADTTNATAMVIHEEWDEDGVRRWDEVGRVNMAFIVTLANHAPALLAAAERDLKAAEEGERLREALREAVAYADAVARANGMPEGKQASRLTATEYSVTGGLTDTAVWNVAEARKLLSPTEPGGAGSSLTNGTAQAGIAEDSNGR